MLNTRASREGAMRALKKTYKGEALLLACANRLICCPTRVRTEVGPLSRDEMWRLNCLAEEHIREFLAGKGVNIVTNSPVPDKGGCDCGDCDSCLMRIFMTVQIPPPFYKFQTIVEPVIFPPPDKTRTTKESRNDIKLLNARVLPWNPEFDAIVAYIDANMIQADHRAPPRRINANFTFSQILERIADVANPARMAETIYTVCDNAVHCAQNTVTKETTEGANDTVQPSQLMPPPNATLQSKVRSLKSTQQKTVARTTASPPLFVDELDMDADNEPFLGFSPPSPEANRLHQVLTTLIANNEAVKPPKRTSAAIAIENSSDNQVDTSNIPRKKATLSDTSVSQSTASHRRSPNIPTSLHAQRWDNWPPFNSSPSPSTTNVQRPSNNSTISSVIGNSHVHSNSTVATKTNDPPQQHGAGNGQPQCNNGPNSVVTAGSNGNSNSTVTTGSNGPPQQYGAGNGQSQWNGHSPHHAPYQTTYYPWNGMWYDSTAFPQYHVDTFGSNPNFINYQSQYMPQQQQNAFMPQPYMQWQQPYYGPPRHQHHPHLPPHWQ